MASISDLERRGLKKAIIKIRELILASGQEEDSRAMARYFRMLASYHSKLGEKARETWALEKALEYDPESRISLTRLAEIGLNNNGLTT
jgi:hypothetical protein